MTVFRDSVKEFEDTMHKIKNIKLDLRKSYTGINYPYMNPKTNLLWESFCVGRLTYYEE